VLTATADRLRERGDPATADLLAGLTEEMNDRTDYQLRLAQLRVRSESQVLTASLNTALLRTVSVLRKTHRGEHLFWNVRFDADVTVNIDRHDLIELVGILLENATKWAESSVEVSAGIHHGMAEVCIADDGPGLTDEQIGDLGDRGRRLDESRPGSGLGLSIAVQILEMNGGTIEFSRSEHKGGLRVLMRLSIAEAG
jgi:signal transduction histidine kinase